MIGRIFMEVLTWGLAGVSFAALLILSFGLTYEQVQAIFNALVA
jgi:hypothetical protein